MQLEELTSVSILDDEVFEEVLSCSDEITMTRLIQDLQDRAKMLGVKKKFDEILNAYKRENRKAQMATMASKRVTDFDVSGTDYDNLYCGQWQATDDGIVSYNIMGMEQVACYHPIMPVKRLKNVQTGEEFLKIAFKRNHRWQELTIQKGVIATASKITKLSDYGVGVTSENAKFLVKYMSDIENWNEDDIPVNVSTSKLGWHEHDIFVPYDDGIVFDSISRFSNLIDSIRENGSREAWYGHVKEIRASGKTEVKFMLAASFASILVEKLEILPFFCDLWGMTEGGKTVALMVAASVWGNPAEGQFIGDFKTTDTALEAKADCLNSLPVILDDTAKTSRKIYDNFEGVVYDLCSGKGKSRSNKELGMNRENHWHNCFLCSGENPLTDFVSRGGAINRIIEVECGEKVFVDPAGTASLVRENYGFAGKEFVEAVKNIPVEELRKMDERFIKKLNKSDKMQKQIRAVSAILVADELIDKYLFKDGCTISINEAEKVLVDKAEVSDNERAYSWLLDKAEMNQHRFDNESNYEQWGKIEDDGTVVFYVPAFNQLCKEGNFSTKSFLQWAEKNDTIEHDAERPSKVKKINGRSVRCICLKPKKDEQSEEKQGFEDVDDLSELPFV